SDEIGESVFLVHHATIIVPGFAHFAAAADMSDGHHYSAINHAENRRVERDVIGSAIRTVASQIDWPFSIELGAFEMRNRDGNFHAVGCSGENSFHLITGTIVTAWNFPLLEQSTCGARNIVVKNGRRSDKRLVAIA